MEGIGGQESKRPNRRPYTDCPYKKSRSQRIMATIRHNRARGEHAVVCMAGLVKELLLDGVEKEEVMTLLQMEDEEVERLAEKAGMPDVISRKHQKFNKGWVPG